MRPWTNSGPNSPTKLPCASILSGEPDKRLSLICVDWGATNLRAYAVANDGTVTERVENNQGLRSNVQNYPEYLKALIHGWIDDSRPVNVLLSGMVEVRQVGKKFLIFPLQRLHLRLRLRQS